MLTGIGEDLSFVCANVANFWRGQIKQLMKVITKHGMNGTLVEYAIPFHSVIKGQNEKLATSV